MPQDYTNIRVPQDVWDRADEAKGEDESWPEYLLRCAEAGPRDPATREDVRDVLTDVLSPELLTNGQVRDALDLDDDAPDGYVCGFCGGDHPGAACPKGPGDDTDD